MKVIIHFITSSILAAVLYPTFSWKVFLIIAGGVLIDIDHYLWYAYKYKNFSLVKSYKFYAANAEKYKIHAGILLIFHSIEFLVVLAVISFYTEFALLLTIGLLLHHLLDLIWVYFVPKRFIINYSVIAWVIKNKIQKL
jgi:hypothetical protein